MSNKITQILEAWTDRSLLSNPTYKAIVDNVIQELNDGKIRVAEPVDGKEGEEWQVNEWVKKAILLYFISQTMKPEEVGIFSYNDKIPLKSDFAEKGVRVVPPATVRHGAYLAPGAILMPSYVNIGAYVGERTMIDTWATVGSCAQIGNDVHLSGGVGIGGVLEPPQAAPVIIGDGAFIGSRCIVVEGARIGSRAVLGAGVTITGSSKVIDVTGEKPVEYKGFVPANSVVIPGSYTKEFPAGSFQVPCALIIGQRKASTDLKTSLNEALRENNVAV
ncbi:2,3,4,5-tetrahydropyridine-2,6-dicarboxylate N-succinyltransferase [uncultured Fibrella sp.]|uniref:2,3,4,5-tetrahydropyridine-2,6-dicarboxylate N-succinyltransferase n=1 Tax=uncultured Fibrella sp. TaxID=1284596 RepID=UPI0035CAB798